MLLYHLHYMLSYVLYVEENGELSLEGNISIKNWGFKYQFLSMKPKGMISAPICTYLYKI